MKKTLILIMIVLSFGFVNVKAVDDVTLCSDAKSAILMEMTTRTVIYEKNADEVRAPASMTKIMTMLLVMEALEKETITMESMVIASSLATHMGGSQIYLEDGEQMSVEDLFKSVCIASANDAAVALAEHVGGSYDNFLKMMNNKAKNLGMTNTTFKNANGLPETGHVTTARDMAILSCELLENYGNTVLKYTNTYEDYVRKGTTKEIWLVNTNKLVKFVNEVDGLKTGWTDEAGYCLSATIKKNNVRYVAVAMGCSTSKIRNTEIMQMLNYASNNYELEQIYAKDDVIKTYENITLTPNIYNIVVSKDINVLKKKGEGIGTVTNEVEITFNPDDVNTNKVGTIKIFIDGKLLCEEELEVLEELKQKEFIDVFFEVIRELFLVS